MTDTQAMTIRLPAGVYKQLRREAFNSKQSMNEIITGALARQFGDRKGMVYVQVDGEHVIVTDQDDPQEVYRIGPDGESWKPGWRDLGRQTVGDESTHHPAGSVVGRAAQKILTIQQEATP